MYVRKNCSDKCHISQKDRKQGRHSKLSVMNIQQKNAVINDEEEWCECIYFQHGI
jgi:hypothetical protein